MNHDKVELDMEIRLESELGSQFGSVKEEQKPSPEDPGNVT